jgi:hypothetical protein
MKSSQSEDSFLKKNPFGPLPTRGGGIGWGLELTRSFQSRFLPCVVFLIACSSSLDQTATPTLVRKGEGANRELFNVRCVVPRRDVEHSICHAKILGENLSCFTQAEIHIPGSGDG